MNMLLKLIKGLIFIIHEKKSVHHLNLIITALFHKLYFLNMWKK